MNQSSSWEELHQPDDRDGRWDDKMIGYPDNGDAVDSYVQHRFNKDYYGEVNGLLRYWIQSLNVGKKGVIYRDPTQIIESFANGKHHTDKGTLQQKAWDMLICYNGLYNVMKRDKSIILIDFERMVNDLRYLRKVFDTFGIVDVQLRTSMMKQKVNPSPRKVLYHQLPVVSMMEKCQWADYNKLNNWL
jgi:hypothetical protein